MQQFVFYFLAEVYKIYIEAVNCKQEYFFFWVVINQSMPIHFFFLYIFSHLVVRWKACTNRNNKEDEDSCFWFSQSKALKSLDSYCTIN